MTGDRTKNLNHNLNYKPILFALLFGAMLLLTAAALTDSVFAKSMPKTASPESMTASTSNSFADTFVYSAKNLIAKNSFFSKYYAANYKRAENSKPVIYVTDNADEEYSKIVPQISTPELFEKARLDELGGKVPAIVSFVGERREQPYEQNKQRYISIVQGNNIELATYASLWIANGLALNIENYDDMVRLSENPEVERIWYEDPRETKLTMPFVNEHLNTSAIWNLTDSNGRRLTGQGVIVASLDTGVNYRHMDLGNCSSQGAGCGKIIAGFNWVNNNSEIMDVDSSHHGSAMIGEIAANGTLQGIAPGAWIVSEKIFATGGFNSPTTFFQGLQDALQNNASIIHVALQYGATPIDCRDSTVGNITESAMSDNPYLLMVISAGNDGGGGGSGAPSSIIRIASPGCSKKALTVATFIMPEDYPDTYASPGPQYISRSKNYRGYVKPEISAPGSGICTTRPAPPNAPGYNCSAVWGYPLALSDKPTLYSLSGFYGDTSSSSAITAGIAALVRQAHPELDGQQLKSVIMMTAADTPFSVLKTGAGKVNPVKAVFDGKIITSPVSVDTLNISGTSQNYNVSVTNIADGQLSISLNYDIRWSNLAQQGLMNSTAGFDPLPRALNFSTRTLTLAPGQTKSFTFNVLGGGIPLCKVTQQGILNNETVYYTGNIKFNTRDDTGKLSVYNFPVIIQWKFQASPVIDGVMDVAVESMRYNSTNSSVVTKVCNYAYQPITGRTLNVYQGNNLMGTRTIPALNSCGQCADVSVPLVITPHDVMTYGSLPFRASIPVTGTERDYANNELTTSLVLSEPAPMMY